LLPPGAGRRVIGVRTPSAASRVRRASSSRLDTQRAGGAAGFRSPRYWDPRAATARPEARTAPRSRGARHREVAEQASSHQGVPWQDFRSKSDTGIEFPERLVTSSALARNSPGESLTEQARMAPVPPGRRSPRFPEKSERCHAGTGPRVVSIPRAQSRRGALLARGGSVDLITGSGLIIVAAATPPHPE
jgi:hypothetical protein